MCVTAGAAGEEDALDEEVTHGRAFQIKHHVSRRSIQTRRSASLSKERPERSPRNMAGKEVEGETSRGNQAGSANASSAEEGAGRV